MSRAEHWPADRVDGEHFDGVALVEGKPTWWRIPTPELVARVRSAAVSALANSPLTREQAARPLWVAWVMAGTEHERRSLSAGRSL